VRVWDLPAGYLNRQSLFGEHPELHGIFAIVRDGKTGYARHPETQRWVRALGGLVGRHRQLVAEMRLRGYVDRTPLAWPKGRASWPRIFVTDPAEQIVLLRWKYVGKDKGRIALPRSPADLWAQHRYSVLARGPKTYRRLRRVVARSEISSMSALARELVLVLRERPARGRLAQTVELMWRQVRGHATGEDVAAARRGPLDALERTQVLALRVRDRRLLQSTALSELAVYL